jgi:hypothetical protein
MTLDEIERDLAEDLDALSPDDRAERAFRAGVNKRSGPAIGRPMVDGVVGASEIPYFIIHVHGWREEFAAEGHGWLWSIRGVYARSYRAFLEAEEG